jgi:peptide/nickel transport system ATP-binding protein
MSERVTDPFGRSSATLAGADEPLVEVRELVKHFPITRGVIFQRQIGAVRAVDGVSFDVRRGETLGIVGETGCGKSTTAKLIMRLLDPTAGRVRFDGQDITGLRGARLKAVRREMQMIFQDPFSSLNSRMTLLDIVGEPLEVNGVGNRQERVDAVAQLLRLVGLRPEYMRRYPHAFSGGQRQRIGIARALALNPRLVVADEPVSALDVSVQAQILNLMLELQERLQLTYLFVAHDLSVVKHISDRVAVMYVGQMVEMTETDTLFASPKHPYTAALLSAIPEPDPRARRRRSRAGPARPRTVLQGEVANPAAPPSGCYFHPRCQYAVDLCKTVAPTWEELEPGHFVRCHRSRELQLAGVSGPPGQ